MSRTVIDLDDDALAAAAAELGTKTNVETVNRALAEIATRRNRLAFLDGIRNTDNDLGNPEVMRSAWR